MTGRAQPTIGCTPASLVSRPRTPARRRGWRGRSGPPPACLRRPPGGRSVGLDRPFEQGIGRPDAKMDEARSLDRSPVTPLAPPTQPANCATWQTIQTKPATETSAGSSRMRPKHGDTSQVHCLFWFNIHGLFRCQARYGRLLRALHQRRHLRDENVGLWETPWASGGLRRRDVPAMPPTPAMHGFYQPHRSTKDLRRQRRLARP